MQHQLVIEWLVSASMKACKELLDELREEQLGGHQRARLRHDLSIVPEQLHEGSQRDVGLLRVLERTFAVGELQLLRLNSNRVRLQVFAYNSVPEAVERLRESGPGSGLRVRGETPAHDVVESPREGMTGSALYDAAKRWRPMPDLVSEIATSVREKFARYDIWTDVMPVPEDVT